MNITSQSPSIIGIEGECNRAPQFLPLRITHGGTAMLWSLNSSLLRWIQALNTSLVNEQHYHGPLRDRRKGIPTTTTEDAFAAATATASASATASPFPQRARLTR
jgi:hypothetical protein